MNANARFFYVLAGFFFISDVIYWFTSEDPTGTTALAFSFGLAFLIAYYLQFNARRLPPQPADLAEADIADGAGEVGFFSPHSYWPFYMGLAAAVMMLGLVFGWWLFVGGLVAFGLSSLGLVFEYYLGATGGGETSERLRS